MFHSGILIAPSQLILCGGNIVVHFNNKRTGNLTNYLTIKVAARETFSFYEIFFKGSVYDHHPSPKEDLSKMFSRIAALLSMIQGAMSAVLMDAVKLPAEYQEVQKHFDKMAEVCKVLKNILSLFLMIYL